MEQKVSLLGKGPPEYDDVPILVVDRKPRSAYSPKTSRWSKCCWGLVGLAAVIASFTASAFLLKYMNADKYDGSVFVNIFYPASSSGVVISVGDEVRTATGNGSPSSMLNEQNAPPSKTCAIPAGSKVDCLPGPGSTQAKCVAKGLLKGT